MTKRSERAAARRSARGRGDDKSLVRFVVGDTQYAFEVSNVEEVVQASEATSLPRMGDAVTGVFDHRGRVTPIVALRPRFGLPIDDSRRGSKWILMRTQSGLVAFVVDRVLDVVGPDEPAGPPPEVGPGADDRAIRGVVPIDGTLVFVLDENRLARAVASLELPGGIR